MSNEVISTKSAPQAIGPYSQGVAVPGNSKLIFFSGQIAIDPQSGRAELCSHSVADQTHQIMKNIKGLLESVDCDFGSIAKVTIFLTDLNDFGVVNDIYGSHFSDSPPARSTVQVSALPLGAKVEIECVVTKNV